MVTSVPETLGFLAPIARHFRGEGWRVGALTGSRAGLADGDGAAFDEVRVAGWGRDPRDLAGLARGLRAVRRLASERAYDIVHVHTPVAAFVTRLALRGRVARGGPRVVYTAHGFHFHAGGAAAANAAFLAAERLAGRWTDHLVVLNREDRAAALRHRIVPPHRLHLMPGIGVDLEAYARGAVDPAEVAALRRSLGVGDDALVLCVAEFTANKRHLDVVRAFARVAADPSAPAARLLLAGRGGLEATTRAEVERLGLAQRVLFLGQRGDVPVLMRASSALVLASAREGLPRSVLEAMAMGLPVAGSRIRGTTELLEDGCGWLFDVGDTQVLAALLRRALRDPSLGAAVARRARERVVRYDLRNVIRLHEELYALALGHGPETSVAGGTAERARPAGDLVPREVAWRRQPAPQDRADRMPP